MTENEAFVDLVRQAMASGAYYFAANQPQFRGSQKSLVEHFQETAEEFVGFRSDLLDQIKEASA